LKPEASANTIRFSFVEVQSQEKEDAASMSRDCVLVLTYYRTNVS